MSRSTRRQFDASEAREYWRRMHSLGSKLAGTTDAERLAVVCHAGAPRWFNEHVASAQRRAFEHALARFGPLAGKRVLDVGCGSGRWSRLLRDRGANVTAIDVSPEVIADNHRRIPGVEFVANDFLAHDFADHSFDLVVSVTVLQHFPPREQDETIAKLARVCRPGGFALLIENTHDRHVHTFAREYGEWLALLEGHGFRRVDARGVDFDLPLRAWSTAVAAGRRVTSALREGSDPRADHPRPSPGSVAEASFAERPSRPRLLYRFAVHRTLVAASAALEPVCQALLPPAWATHCALALERDR
jgi:2-polyprenyl-3-methyl-5-hydroxy-6-metoxy-1,4-benzoquinol methylase